MAEDRACPCRGILLSLLGTQSCVRAQVMQIYQMDAMNFRFMGHPSAWVVHRPHAPSSGYNHTFTGEAYTQVIPALHWTDLKEPDEKQRCTAVAEAAWAASTASSSQ